MINRLLHLLSNRKVFNEPLFMPDSTFIPAKFNSDITDFRHRLLLDVTNTDYYLKVCLGIMEAYQDLKLQFEDAQTTYKMSDFIPRGVQINGGELVSSTAIGGFFTDPPNTSLPLPLTYTIGHNGQYNLSCLIKAIETGTSWIATCALFNNPDGVILQINWPPGVPFSGAIRLEQVWGDDSQVEITVAPSQFPYGVLLTRAMGSAYLPVLLANTNLLAAFDCSFDPTEKLAIIFTALALTSPSATIF